MLENLIWQLQKSWVVTNTALHLVVRENYIANQKKCAASRDGEASLNKISKEQTVKVSIDESSYGKLIVFINEGYYRQC